MNYKTENNDRRIIEGKKGIIFGALNDRSIAWQVALKAHQHGAALVLTNSR